MFSKKDYSKMTLEELVSEQQKMNGQKTTAAVLIGFFIGVAVWSATHKGGFVTYFLLFAALFIGYTHTQTLKNIQAEMNRRNS